MKETVELNDKVDLKEYRLKDSSELSELLKDKNFEIFFSDTWNFLDKMKENSFFNFYNYFNRSEGLKCPLQQKHLEWFIKVVCVYISEIIHLEYELTDDFTTVVRKLDDKLMQKFKHQCAENYRKRNQQRLLESLPDNI